MIRVYIHAQACGDIERLTTSELLFVAMVATLEVTEHPTWKTREERMRTAGGYFKVPTPRQVQLIEKKENAFLVPGSRSLAEILFQNIYALA